MKPRDEISAAISAPPRGQARRWWDFSPPAFRRARVQGRIWPPLPVPATWSRSACRSAIRWPTAPPSSARASRAGRRRDAAVDTRAIAGRSRGTRSDSADELFEPAACVRARAGCRATRRLPGVAGFIVPDLPFEESGDLKAALDREGLALVQMVTPVTPPDRLRCSAVAAAGLRLRGDDDRHDRQVGWSARRGARLHGPRQALLDEFRCARASAFARANRSPASRARRRRGGRVGAGRGAGARRGRRRFLHDRHRLR
jgi:hypothetical protein